MSAETIQQIREAVDRLARGEPIALPTDTQYALAADALNPDAIAAIFRIKQRPGAESLPVFLPSLDWLDRAAAAAPPRIRGLAELVWPGAVTLILPKHPKFETNAVAGETIALRIPDHPVARQVLDDFDKPLTGTSANLHGQPAALTPDDVRGQLGNAVHIVEPGGVLPAGPASTILDCAGPIPRVLRKGPELDPRIGEWLVEHWGMPEPDAAGG